MLAVFILAALFCFALGFVFGKAHKTFAETEQSDKYEGCSTQELLKIVAENCDSCKYKRKRPKPKKQTEVKQ